MTELSELASIVVDRNPMTPDRPFFAAVTNPYPGGADVHEAFELGVLLAGQKRIHFEGVVLELLPGDVWLSPGYEVHGWSSGDPNAREVWVQFLPQLLGAEESRGVPWLSMFAAPAHTRPLAGSAETRRQLLAIARDLAAEVEEKPVAWEESVRLGLLRLLLALYREWEHRDSAWMQSRPGANRLSQVIPALELVYAGSSHRTDLGTAAAACGFERSYFGQVFRQTMGVSFSRYEVRARLTRAARLVMYTAAPVAAIAEQTGFVDASHFHRRFAEVYGCTPASYRRRASQPIP